MDPGTLIGVVSLSIETIQVCCRIFNTYADYKRSLSSIPETLSTVHSRLVILKGTLERIEIEEDVQGKRESSINHHRKTCDVIKIELSKLQEILELLQKRPTDSKIKLGVKSFKSGGKEKEVKRISLVLDSAVADLILARIESLKSCVLSQGRHEPVIPIPRLPLAASYGLPPPHASNLVGRENTISELKAMLFQDPHRTCLINMWGLSGQGKTRIILELAHDASIREAYSTVMYVNATSINAVERQFERVASDILQPGGSLPDTQAKTNFVLATLEQLTKPTLFIFDNINEDIRFDELTPYLPLHRPYGFLSSRTHSDHSFSGKSIMIPALSIESAVELLLERSGHSADITHVVQSRKIVYKLGCLPLAIVQAGAWLRSSKLPLHQFFAEFHLYFPFVFQNEGTRDVPTRNVSTTWTMAMEVFSPDKKTRDDMTQMLLFCSILHNDVINGRFGKYLWPNADEVPAWMTTFLVNGIWSDATFIAVVRRLGDLALINILDWRDGHCHFSIHPMVRHWLRTRVRSSTLVETVVHAMKLVVDSIARAGNVPMELKKQNHLRLYLASCLQSLAELGETDGSTELLRPYSREVLDYKYSFVSFVGTLATSTESEDDGHRSQDRFVDEIALLEECYSGYTQLLGAVSPLVSEIANRLGDAYTNRSQFEQAEKVLKEDLRLHAKPMSASLAKCFRKQGKETEAVEAYDVILSESNMKSLSRDELIRSMLGCALNDYELKEFEQAEKWLLEVVRNAESGPVHGKFKAEACEKLSDLYWLWDRRMEAAEWQLKAFQTYETVYGLHDGRSLEVGHTLAKVYFSMSEWHRCESLYQKIIEGYEAVYGSKHNTQTLHGTATAIRSCRWVA